MVTTININILIHFTTWKKTKAQLKLTLLQQQMTD
jgi:hypothetical protein